MYAYKVVERALFQLHGQEPSRQAAFRGRIQHFQRLGLVPSSPGKGKRIEYTFEDVARWAFALQLAEFGIDPVSIKSILQFSWQSVYNEGLRLNINQAVPVFFVSDPCVVSRRDFWHQFFFIVGPAHRSWPKPERAGRALIISLTDVGSALRTALAVDPNETLPPSQFATDKTARAQEILAGILGGGGDEPAE